MVLGADAALQAFPAARVAVEVSGLGAAARGCLEDPRVVMTTPGGGSGEPPRRAGLVPPPRGAGVTDPSGSAGLGEPPLADAPDWDVLVHEPLRPAEPGRRPDPRAAAELLLRLERAGVDTVVLTAGRGDADADPVREVGRLTGVRGRRREGQIGRAHV